MFRSFWPPAMETLQIYTVHVTSLKLRNVEEIHNFKLAKLVSGEQYVYILNSISVSGSAICRFYFTFDNSEFCKHDMTVKAVILYVTTVTERCVIA
jgi:hypothetical protein